MTPDYLARITGLPIEDVTACMARFCEADPYSRTPTDEGRRLTLIDPDSRAWGWKVVNHAQYRERARKQQWDNERTASERDAERKRQERAQAKGKSGTSREIPTRPDCPRSQTQTHLLESSKTRTLVRGERGPESPRRTRVENFMTR